jgi:tetratricopeptide (TPR) repeat protein
VTMKRSLRFVLAMSTALAFGQPALSSDVGDAGAYLAARLAAIAGDYRNAGLYYVKALVADPDNPILMEGAITAQIGLGEFQAASAIARRMLQLGINSQAAYVVSLVDRLHRKAYEEAIADIAAGNSIGSLIDGLVTAWAELGAGQMSEALAGFDHLATAQGLQAFGLYHKALALASVGDFEGADDVLSGRAGGTVKLIRRGVIAHAQVLSQLERNADALALLDLNFNDRADPQIADLRARLTAGETLPFDIVRDANDGLAEVFFTVATALDGEASDGYTLIYSRVAEYLRPDHTEAALLSANLLESQGQFDLATEAFSRISRDDPAFHAAEIGRAQSLYEAGNKDSAIEALQKLGQTHPDMMTVHMALGDVLRREERYEEAAAAYDRAVKLIDVPDVRHWPLYYSRAICYERIKRWDLAEPDFRKALELSPEEPQVLNYLGYSFVEMNQNLDEALDLIERAVAARPDDGYIVDSLAWVLFGFGRYQEAVEPMERASLLMPVDPIVTDHLGDVYWAVGRTLEARFQWRRALSFEPEEAEADRIRRKLEVGLDVVLAEEGQPSLAERTDAH